jgi:hypothetical protein
MKAEETDQQLHLLALQESEINLTIAQTALQAGENEISAGESRQNPSNGESTFREIE